MITPAGLVLLALGLVVFVMPRGRLYLLLLAIFFSGFNAISIANFGSGISAKGIPPSLMFAGLFLLRSLISGRILRSLLHGVTRFQAILVVIMVIFGLSMLSPVINAGVSFVGADPHTTSFQRYILEFSYRNLTQWLYFVLWGLTVIVAAHMLDMRGVRVVLRVFIIGAVVVAIIGLLQFGSGFLPIPNPTLWLNNNANPFAHGYLQVIVGTHIPRISSVATEPSEFAKLLLFSLAFLIPNGVIYGWYLFSKSVDMVIVALLLLVLLLSTATTAYVGLVALAMLIAFGSLAAGRGLGRSILLILGGVAVLVTAVLTVPLLHHVVTSYLLDKANTGSFHQRLGSFGLGVQVFFEHPLLGIGIGSMTVYSLPFSLLANTGLAGFVSFGFFTLIGMAPAFYRTRERDVSEYKKYVALWPTSRFLAVASFAFTVMVVVSTVSGFSYYYGYNWLPVLVLLTLFRLKRLALRRVPQG